MIIRKTREEIALMKLAGQTVAEILNILAKAVKPGVLTGDLNSIAEEECRKRGAIPLFKNYPNPAGGPPFPGVICASVNDEVVHGIPGNRVLKEGDIISIDFGASVEGFAGDSAITVPVGVISPEVARLLVITKESLMKGIEQARPGNRLGMISHAIQRYAEKHGLHVVRELVGHGIGRQMHEDPQVPNYGRPGQGPILKEGMTIAIEPMLNLGTRKVYTKSDHWTVVTADGSYSAHFEHTVAISERGPEILTLGNGGG
ncbi:MAG: type I methionyl aminopeptidase [Syntrophomonadaceae bacterium]|jgi:methionyl aminopeptidase